LETGGRHSSAGAELTRPGWNPRVLAGLCLLFGAPTALFIVLRAVPSIDPMVKAETFHFWIVSAASLLGLGVAVAVLRASMARDDIWVFFVGLGFLSVSAVFLLHSLATQNVLLHGPHPSFSTSPPASLGAGALFFGLSAIHYRRGIEGLLVRSRPALIALWLAAYSAYAIVVFALSDKMTAQAPVNSSIGYGSSLGGGTLAAVISVVTAVTLALFAAALLRYAFLLRRRQSTVLVAVMAGLALFLNAEIAMMLSPVWHASWWLYHVSMLAGVVLSAYGILLEYRRHKTFSAMFDGLTIREARARIERDYNEATRALVAAVEAKDSYTRGHSARVSQYAVRIAEGMGLEDRDLERIRHAAVLHDIGKIAVSELLLNKTGALEPAEFDAVQRHPEAGQTMLETVPSLHQMVPGIRGHHERFDGSGYPDGLTGEHIHMDARIIAVADVYDALTSNRSYRGALSTEETLDIITRGSGSHFDPRCVDAFLQAGIVPAGPLATDGASGD